VFAPTEDREPHPEVTLAAGPWHVSRWYGGVELGARVVPGLARAEAASCSRSPRAWTCRTSSGGATAFGDTTTDQIFVPEFNAGAMNPQSGDLQSDQGLPWNRSRTIPSLRAKVIAHEMAQ
jgi:hypothetical protein